MTKYIKCDCCGNKINLGTEVYKFAGYAGLFCSAECFAYSYGEVHELTDELVEGCYHTIYDDDTRKLEIKSEIDAATKKIESLLKEFAALME